MTPSPQGSREPRSPGFRSVRNPGDFFALVTHERRIMGSRGLALQLGISRQPTRDPETCGSRVFMRPDKGLNFPGLKGVGIRSWCTGVSACPSAVRCGLAMGVSGIHGRLRPIQRLQDACLGGRFWGNTRLVGLGVRDFGNRFFVSDGSSAKSS